MSTFKNRHPELQHLVRELKLVREDNLRFKDGDPQEKLLMFAEAALVCLVLERFVRAVLGDAGHGETLYNLLERAVARKLLTVPWDDPQDGIRKIAEVRNILLHANYEQAAAGEHQASVEAYFKRSFASTIETFYKITNHIVDQIDVNTGQPKSRR